MRLDYAVKEVLLNDMLVPGRKYDLLEPYGPNTRNICGVFYKNSRIEKDAQGADVLWWWFVDATGCDACAVAVNWTGRVVPSK